MVIRMISQICSFEYIGNIGHTELKMDRFWLFSLVNLNLRWTKVIFCYFSSDSGGFGETDGNEEPKDYSQHTQTTWRSQKMEGMIKGKKTKLPTITSPSPFYLVLLNI